MADVRIVEHGMTNKKRQFIGKRLHLVGYGYETRFDIRIGGLEVIPRTGEYFDHIPDENFDLTATYRIEKVVHMILGTEHCIELHGTLVEIVVDTQTMYSEGEENEE